MRVNRDTGFDSTPCHRSARWEWYRATDVLCSANRFTHMHIARDKETHTAGFFWSVDRRGSPPIGVHLRTAVILSAAKDLSLGRVQILRCAQDDSAGLRMTDGVVAPVGESQ